MSIRKAQDSCIVLEGHCSVEDVEPLLQGLLESPAAKIDWRDCHGAHAAVVQLMLVSGRGVLGPPSDPFLAARIGPLLRHANN